MAVDTLMVELGSRPFSTWRFASGSFGPQGYTLVSLRALFICCPRNTLLGFGLQVRGVATPVYRSTGHLTEPKEVTPPPRVFVPAPVVGARAAAVPVHYSPDGHPASSVAVTQSWSPPKKTHL